jgi:multidrug transporter EmrE-like cation transporter
LSRLLDHSYIVSSVLFTVYSQLIMRWQVGNAGELPSDTPGKARFVANLLINPWVISGLCATFLSGVSWLLAMTKFEIGYAYPFVSLQYVLVLAASILVFNESTSLTKLVGTAFVVVGIIILSRG